MHPILNIAIRAARKGGNNIIQFYDKKIFNDFEKKKIFIQEIYKTRKIIINIIKNSYPQHNIFTKYNSIKFKNFKNPIWIINLFNGKKNFLKKFPNFCISIVIFFKKILNISVIYDPFRNEIFTAVKGNGAQVNGYRMRCSSFNSLNKSYFSLKLKSIFLNKKKKYLKILKNLFKKGVIFRTTSLIPLDLSYLSDGRIDFMLDFNFKINNYYSGILQVKESGGIISDYKGGCNYNNKIAIIANNSNLLKLIINEIKLLI
ncbi:MAG: inositol monophosphatase [Buchnera aphidicola (Periphyllus acericola)]|uniref:inositol monophosphatase family protein n=1 Tax=Buchnera aphidicola TaxID=9 RepID=UPI0030CBEE3C|nr:inositol monophosphatase [Buchnera aphidicola (Periphyllus acericola)]